MFSKHTHSHTHTRTIAHIRVDVLLDQSDRKFTAQPPASLRLAFSIASFSMSGFHSAISLEGERLALDGQPYTYAEYVHWYGEDALRCWRDRGSDAPMVGRTQAIFAMRLATFQGTGTHIFLWYLSMFFAAEYPQAPAMSSNVQF